jgi:hypothetical protein
MDMIYEMSGPQMWGLGLECELSFPGGRCRGFQKAISITGDRDVDNDVWLALDARGYFSTGKDQDTVKFGWFDTWMAGVDPMVAFGGYDVPVLGRVHHGIGGSFNWLMGNFAPFGNQALKVRFFRFEFPGPLEFTYDLRLYGNGFEGDPLRPDHLRKIEASERVHAFTLTFGR